MPLALTHGLTDNPHAKTLGPEKVRHNAVPVACPIGR